MSAVRFKKLAAGAGACMWTASIGLGILALSTGVGTLQSVAKTTQLQPQPALPEAQSAPAPATSTQPIWLVRCTGVQDGLDCRASQSIVVDRRKRTVLSVAVRVAADTKKPVLLLQVPLGIYLPAGVSLRFGKNVAKLVPYTVCGRAGCMAEHPITEAELAAMLKGTDLKVSAQNKVSAENQDQQPPFTVRVLAAGFAAAYAKIK